MNFLKRRGRIGSRRLGWRRGRRRAFESVCCVTCVLLHGCSRTYLCSFLRRRPYLGGFVAYEFQRFLFNDNLLPVRLDVSPTHVLRHWNPVPLSEHRYIASAIFLPLCEPLILPSPTSKSRFFRSSSNQCATIPINAHRFGAVNHQS
jgi:hypothetical protein